MNANLLPRLDADTICTDCEKPLMVGIETFGDAWDPLCSGCWYARQEPYRGCVYGFFTGGDPRNFSPDPECSTDEEQEHHRQACALWDEAEKRGEKPEPEKCPSGWTVDANGGAIHVLRAPYGLGVQCFGYGGA